MQAHAAILESDGVTDVERKLDAMLSEAGDRDWLATRLRPLLGLDAARGRPRGERRRVGEGRGGDGGARSRPILVFEDLHWADEALLRFLAGLADHVAQVPLLVLATARPEVLERAPGLAASGPRISRLQVRSLERHHLERLIGALLDDASLPADLVRVVRGRCGGNPLYIEEFVRFLSEAEPIPDGDGASAVPAGLPDTLEALIAARLDVLPRRCREVLGDASVIGLEFWRGAVAALEQAEPEDVERELRELVERELVRALPASTVGGDAQYVFRHAVTHDVAYEQLPRAVRAAKHAGVAIWLQDAAGERLDEVSGVLAQHWVTALELSQAVRDERLAEAALAPAVRSLARAGDHALALDVTIAESRYRQALELAPADNPERPRLLARWARALMEDGRMDAALRAFDEGIAGLKTQGDHVATALALGGRSTALQLVGDMERSGRALQEALALLAGERSAARVDLLGQWAGHCMVMADEGEAARVGGETLELAAELGMPAPVLALVARACSRCGAGDARGFEDYAAALAAAGEQGLGREVGIIHFNWAEDIGNLEGPRAALLRYREGLRFAQSRKDQAMSFSLTYGIVRDLFRSGQWAESLEEARALAPRLEAAHNLAELGYVLAVEASLLVARGELVEAQSLLPALEETAFGPGEPILQAGCLVSAAGVRRALGEADAARTPARAAVPGYRA